MIAKVLEAIKQLCSGLFAPFMNGLQSENYILGEEIKSKKFD